MGCVSKKYNNRMNDTIIMTLVERLKKGLKKDMFSLGKSQSIIFISYHPFDIKFTMNHGQIHKNLLSNVRWNPKNAAEGISGHE